MTQHRADLRKEQEKLLELEVAPLTYFMAKEQTKSPLTTVVKDLEKELNQDFSNEDNVVRTQNIIAKKDIKRKKVYSLAKVKARNFLTNLSYKRVKKDDLLNENFIIDCISLTLFNLNPFYLERKFDDAADRDKVETLWTCFIPNEFYFYICQGENYQSLNKIMIKYNTANKKVCDYVNQYGINSLTTFFKQYANVYQFLYFTLFPKYFCRIDNDAIQSRCDFKTTFVNFKVQKNGFNLNIKPENVINTASSTSIKTEPEEKEEIVKNNEKLNQKIKKCNQRKENLLKILMKTQEKWQN